jgi:hypothetical protein
MFEVLDNCLPPKFLKNMILEVVGMEGGNCIISIGRSSALENTIKLIWSETNKGVLYLQGCNYGDTCAAAQVGGYNMSYSCDNFEVLDLKTLSIEEQIEGYREIMGGVVVQPYMKGLRVEDIMLRFLKGACAENNMLLVDDETNMKGAPGWKDIDGDVDVLLIGSDIVWGMFPVEVLVAREGIDCNEIKEEFIHPQIFKIIQDALERRRHE